MLNTPALAGGPLFCPKCGEPQVKRSHRRGPVEHLLSGIGWYPFRCAACRHRFSRWWPGAGLAPARPRRPVWAWIVGALLFLIVAAIDLVVTVSSQQESRTHAPSALLRESSVVPAEVTVSCGADGTVAQTEVCFEIRFRKR